MGIHNRGKLFGRLAEQFRQIDSTLFVRTTDSEKWKVLDFMNAGMQVLRYA